MTELQQDDESRGQHTSGARRAPDAPGAPLAGGDGGGDAGAGARRHGQVAPLGLLHPHVPVTVYAPPAEILGPGLWHIYWLLLYRVISGQLSSPVCVLVVYDEQGEASALVDGGELVGGGRVLGLAHHLGQHGHLQQSVGGSEVATKFCLKRRST